MHHDAMRLYGNSDLIGVELGGALKNVMAIAAGVCDGLGMGNNARAALLTRGLAEIARLGQRMGAKPQTFMGLTGLGDLLLTATGSLSRNRQVGLALAKGDSIARILAGLGHVAEGVHTAEVAVQLAARFDVDMPITQAVHRLVSGELRADQALQALLARAGRQELDDF
jgi:glycerol-3-phosphate dehydrogenase (NAD(P)+)